MKESSTPTAIGSALSAVAMLIAAPTLAASDQPIAVNADVERITVTGTRIKRIDLETASPVAVISAEQINSGNFSTLNEVLEQTTISAGAPTNAASNYSGYGGASVDLRGMGSFRTLVLLNGRRMVLSGIGADASVDLNTIPIAMVERIEILKDGASAIYGSDAVAGVVNIITKKELDGTEIELNYGQAQEGDGKTFDASITTGFEWNSGSGIVGLSVVDRGKAMQTDRDFSSCTLMGPPEEQYCYYDYHVPHGFMDYGNGENAYLDGEEQQGYDLYDYTPYQYLSTPLTTVSLTTHLTQQLGSDSELFFEGLYTYRDSEQQLAPDPVYMDVYLADPAFADSDMCQGGCPWDDFDYDEFTPGVQPPEWGAYYRRLTEAGPRRAEQQTDTVRISTGINGFVDVGSGYEWQLAYTYGRNEADNETANTSNLTAMEQALYANPDEWFSGNDLSQETLDSFIYTDKAEGGNQMNLVNFNISGDAFEMPAGTAALAAGMEYRHDKGWYYPDPVTQSGDSSQTQQASTSGSYSVFELYGELSLPLLVDQPFAQEVTLDLAGRWFDYSTFGSDSTYKIGLSWRVNDDLMLRGVVSTSFRAPNVSELYTGAMGSYEELYDPCSGVTDPSSRCFGDENFYSGYEQYYDYIENTWVTGDDLQPEESDNLTLGVIYNPSWLDGLSMTVDYWSFEISNAITYIDTQQYLNDCYDGNEAACDVLKVERDMFGDISYIESPSINIGMYETSGVDANIQYRFDAAGLEWRLALDSAYMIDSKEDGIEYAGAVSWYGAYPEWRNNLSLDVGGDRWQFHYLLRYIGEMDNQWVDYYGEYRDYEPGKMYTEQLDGVFYSDVSFTYDVTNNSSVIVGIDNLFNQQPPYVVDYWEANTAPEIYDVLGRYFYAGVTMRF